MTTADPDNQAIPSHVAIIMDGNRRWAKNKGLQVNMGHKEGYERFKEIVNLCFEKGVKYVTVYAFSTENWKRSKDEVSGLMGLMSYAIKNEVQNYRERDIKVNIIGRKHDLPDNLKKELEDIESETADKKSNVLNVALSYGGKAEIVDAVNRIITNGGDVTEESISENLYTAGQPDPELIIRTGGNPRLSNFLMWQASYSEIYVTDVLWPDFNPVELDKAFVFFGEINRNFGK
jgi:undecaprenyl diphosphate synthase